MTSKYKRRVAGRFSIVGLLLCSCVLHSARAHHSFSAFDLDQQRTIRGIVVSYEWSDPHVVTIIEAESDNEDRTTSSFEGMSPGYLGRRGWTRSTLQPGDLVEIVYFPRRDGRPGGMLLRAILANGTHKVMLDPN